MRQLAKDQPCLVRLPGCNGGTDTVGAHYRMLPYNGTGLKPPDTMMAFACSHCHDVIDFRKPLDGWNRDQIRLAHAEGVLRTQVHILEGIPVQLDD